jgi:hypothetical protein
MVRFHKHFFIFCLKSFAICLTPPIFPQLFTHLISIFDAIKRALPLKFPRRRFPLIINRLSGVGTDVKNLCNLFLFELCKDFRQALYTFTGIPMNRPGYFKPGFTPSRLLRDFDALSFSIEGLGLF